MLVMTISPHSPRRILPVILCLKFQRRKLLHVSYDLILKDKHIILDKQWCIVYQRAPLQTEVSDQSAWWPDHKQPLHCTPSNILTVSCIKLWLGYKPSHFRRITLMNSTSRISNFRMINHVNCKDLDSVSQQTDHNCRNTKKNGPNSWKPH